MLECSSYGLSTGKSAGRSTAVTAGIVTVVMLTLILAPVGFLLLNTKWYLFVLSNKCCVVH